jgi:hypothetical protein
MAIARLSKDFLENQEQARELMEKKIDELDEQLCLQRNLITGLYDLGLKAQQERDRFKRDRDEARLMVLRLVVSTYRVGWEEGESEEEVFSEARDKLANWGLDLTADRAKCEALLGFKFW